MSIDHINRTALFRNLEKFTCQLNAVAAGDAAPFSIAERVYAIHVIESGMALPANEGVALRAEVTLHGAAAIAAAKALRGHDGNRHDNPFRTDALRAAYSGE